MVGRRPSSLPKLGEKAQQLGSTGVNNSFSPDVDRILQLLFFVQGILMRDSQLLWASLWCRPKDATLVPKLNFHETRTLGNT